METLSNSFLLRPLSHIMGIVQTIRLIVVALVSGCHQIRTEALSIPNAINQNVNHFNSQDDKWFYEDHMWPYNAGWNWVQLSLSIFTKPDLFFISQIPNILFAASPNGIYEHQGTRIYKVFIKCLNRVDRELLMDKVVTLRKENGI